MSLLLLTILVCVASPLAVAAFVLASRMPHAGVDEDAADLVARQGLDRVTELANAMPQIVWIAAPDGTLSFINDCWFEYTGQRRYGSDWGAAVHPDDLVQLQEAAVAGRATGRQHKLQYRVRRAQDGEYRWQRARCTPMRDARGAITAWWGIATDVHDQLEAQRTLQAANEEMERRVAERTAALAAERTFLAAVLDSLHDSIVACDADGRITVVNRAVQELLNLPSDNVQLGFTSEFYGVYESDGETPMPPDSMPLPRILRGEEVRDTVLVVAPAYARSRTIVASGRPILGADERPLGAVIALNDITAQRDAERALTTAREHADAAERARRDFVARMSRELRAPLDAIVGLSDVLRRDAAARLTDVQAQLLGRLGTNARHLVALVDDLHDLCDVEAGRATMPLAPTRVEEVVADVIDAHRERAAARALLLDVSAPPVLNPVTTDAARLGQVLTALVGNAIKFTVRGGVTITIVVDQASGVPRAVEVRDTGVGMSDARRRAIFQPLDVARDADGAAEGVGLAITRSLCQALRYDLSVTSEPGAGSTFTVTFPADEARLAHRAA